MHMKGVREHAPRASHRRQDVSVKPSFVVSLAVVARFRLRRRHLGRLRALRLVVRVGHGGVVVLLAGVVMAQRLLLVGGLQVLPLLFLFVLLVLFQPLFTLLDPHELDPALLPAQNHWSKKKKKNSKNMSKKTCYSGERAATHSALFKREGKI